MQFVAARKKPRYLATNAQTGQAGHHFFPATYAHVTAKMYWKSLHVVLVLFDV